MVPKPLIFSASLPPVASAGRKRDSVDKNHSPGPERSKRAGAKPSPPSPTPPGL